MNAFWHGFYKQAASPLGQMKGISSGLNLKANVRTGELPGARPKSGISTGGRTSPPPLPTPVKTNHQVAAAPTVATIAPPTPKNNLMGRPTAQRGRGVASATV